MANFNIVYFVIVLVMAVYVLIAGRELIKESKSISGELTKWYISITVISELAFVIMLICCLYREEQGCQVSGLF